MIASDQWAGKLDGDPAKQLWDRIDESTAYVIMSHLDAMPVPVGRIATALHLRVLTAALDPDISGLIRRLPGNVEQHEIKVNVADVAARQRFTVAHEIGHFALHRHLIGSDGITDTILFRSKLSNKQEAEANRLAASILLPWAAVHQYCFERFGVAPSEENMAAIAKAFVVSELTVGFRFGF